MEHGIRVMSLEQLEEAHARAIDIGADATRRKIVQEVVRRTTVKLRTIAA